MFKDIIELLKVVAWPVVTLVIIAFFYKDIRLLIRALGELLGRLKQGSGKLFGQEFSLQLDDLQEKAVAAETEVLSAICRGTGCRIHGAECPCNRIAPSFRRGNLSNPFARKNLAFLS